MQVREKITVCTPDKLYSKEVYALFDTGAKATYISEKLGKEVGFISHREPLRIPLAVRGKEADVVGKAYIDLILTDWELPSHAHVVRDLAEDVIIGTSLMEEYDIELDLKEGRARLRKSPPELRLV